MRVVVYYLTIVFLIPVLCRDEETYKSCPSFRKIGSIPFAVGIYPALPVSVDCNPKTFQKCVVF